MAAVGKYLVAALLHKPFGSARRAAYSDGLNAFGPRRVDFVGPLDEVAVGVYALAFVEEHAPVAALASAHEEYQVVAFGERADVRHAVGHLAAYRVEALERGFGRYVGRYVVDYPVELVERLRCLRV